MRPLPPCSCLCRLQRSLACCLPLLLAALAGGWPFCARAQTVSSTFDGVNNPIRLEFWSQGDGPFDWFPPEQYRATGTWTADEITSVERGISYWWEVLGANRTPGRELTFRMVRSGEEYVPDDDIWKTATTHSSSPSLLIGAYRRNTTNHVWAFGGTQPSSQAADTVINFEKSEDGYARNGPLQLVAGVNLEITTIHEIGHTLGIAGGIGTFGLGGALSLYESQVVTIRDDGTRIQVKIGDLIGRYDRFYFNGEYARAVYGDTVVGEAGRPVPLATESNQKSHLGIDAFTMTHENFRNYPFFNEVELAVLNDLGYGIDLRKHFGRSIYTNGSDSSPVIENQAGYDSSATYGVGLHIKASGRHVVQQVDLNASGIAGNGIRVDGNQNHVTVDQGVTVSANGDYGIGLLVSNGRFNNVVHRGTIEATSTSEGAAGTGIMIGFGYDTMGPEDGDNRNSATPSGFSGGYLVEQLDISGAVHAGSNAIAIDHTAAVKQINILSGTNLTGDIAVDALTGTAHAFSRPTITFGRLADDSGAATDEADPLFSLDYGGNIGGKTLMDAEFHGGRDHATGAHLAGSIAFHSVQIGEQGRVTTSGQITSTQAIAVDGVLNSVGGEVTSQESVVVRDGGRLSGTGTINAPLVQNQQGGTMFAGNSIGTLNIVGNFESNGDLLFDVTHQDLPQDASLYRIVGGTATINATARGEFQFRGDDPSDPSNYQIARRYTIIETDVPGALQISQRPQASDDLDSRRMILRSNTDVAGFYTSGAQAYYAYVGRDVPFATLGQTANQQAIGEYFDALFTLDDGSLLGDQVQWFRDSLDLISDEHAVLGALNQMTGELYASIAPMLVQQSYLMQNRITGRLRQDEACLNWCDEDGEPRSSGFGGWATGFGTGGSTGSDGNVAGYGYSAGGTQLVVTSALSCNTLIGGYYNYTGANFGAGWAGSANAQANEFGVLFAHHTDVAHLLLVAGGGTVDIDARRGFAFGNTDLQVPVFESLTGNYDGTLANVYGEYGRRYGRGNTTYRPFLGLGYVLYSQGNITEQSNGLGALTINGTSITSLRSFIGLDTSTLMRPQGNLRLDARAIWMHDFLNNGVATVLSNFSGTPGLGFAVQGVALGRDFAVIGTSLSRNLVNDNTRLFAGYDLFANGQQALNAGYAGLEVLW